MAIEINFKLKDEANELRFSNRLCEAFAGFREFVNSDVFIGDRENVCTMIVGAQDEEITTVENIKLTEV